MKPVLIALGVVAAIVGLSVGGWWLHWALAAKATNNQAHINRSQFGFQQTLRDQITQNITDEGKIAVQIAQTTDPTERAQLQAQDQAVTNLVCTKATQVTGDPLPSFDAMWVTAHCPEGTLG